MRGFAFKNRVFWHRKMATCGRVAHFPTEMKRTHKKSGEWDADSRGKTRIVSILSLKSVFKVGLFTIAQHIYFLATEGNALGYQVRFSE